MYVDKRDSGDGWTNINENKGGFKDEHHEYTMFQSWT